MDPPEACRADGAAEGSLRRTAGPAWRVLIDRCRDGEEQAWKEFFTAFQAFAQRRLRRQFPALGLSDRADLIAATLERLMIAVRADRIHGTTDAEVGAYIARAVRHRALDLIDRRRPEAQLEEGARHDGVNDERGYQRALVQKVTDIVSAWSPTEQYLFIQKSHGVPSERIKRELEQHPYSEFIDVATVDTRYHRLRSRLRSRLQC
jgi:DNA-directed RNA polymerase specialized sigma24 family protein